MNTPVQKLSQLSKRVRLAISGNPSKPWEQQDKWQQDANGYRCTLHYRGRQYSFDFWQGIGISRQPTAEDTLECLLIDSSAGNSTFEDFCSEFGYDQDSRKAEATWKSCQQTAKHMKRLLGEDYETFLYADRD